MKMKLKYLPSLILTLITMLSLLALLAPSASADTPADAVVNVTEGCAFDDDYSHTFTLSFAPGLVVNTESATRPTINVTCNNPNGFKINTIGFSPDATHASGNEGNTFMYGSTGVNIATGTSGTSSYWSMKISSATATRADGGTPAATVSIQSPYSAYSNVPATSTPVISYGAVTDSTVNGTMRADYQVSLATDQAAGTYTGKVKYTVVPNGS